MIYKLVIYCWEANLSTSIWSQCTSIEYDFYILHFIILQWITNGWTSITMYNLNNVWPLFNLGLKLFFTSFGHWFCLGAIPVQPKRCLNLWYVQLLLLVSIWMCRHPKHWQIHLIMLWWVSVFLFFGNRSTCTSNIHLQFVSVVLCFLSSFHFYFC